MKTYMDGISFFRLLIYKLLSQIQIWFYWIRDTYFCKFEQGLFQWVFLYTIVWVIVSSNSVILPFMY